MFNTKLLTNNLLIKFILFTTMVFCLTLLGCSSDADETTTGSGTFDGLFTAISEITLGPSYDIAINEFFFRSNSDVPDYVELYNKSSEPFVFSENEWELVDLDREANNEAGMTIPAGTEIPGHGFIVLLPDLLMGATLPNGAPANAILNNNEETV